MSLRRSPFAPPAALREPHVQSVLSSSPLRAIRARRRLHAIEASHEAMVLDVGNGIRLQGVHSAPASGTASASRTCTESPRR